MSDLSNNLPKRLHVIGICGVATSAIAIAFHKKGVKVTGSDKGFFAPISTELEKNSIPFYAGWHPEKIEEFGKPDIIMAGGSGTSPSNPEAIYAKDHSIPLFSYAEILGKYFAKKSSIVTTGTWGKTSSSALLSFILEQTGFDPSYMFGGVSLSHEASAKLSDSDWNVFEGDEYQASISDKKAKFFYYKPTHLLLSAISWDHADMYPTEESYFGAFRKLIKGIPKDGLIVGCADREKVVELLKDFKGKKVMYGRHGGDSAYQYSNISQSENGLHFTITHDCKDYTIHSPMLGAYQAENITGCFAMAHEIGIRPEKTIEAIAEFKGLKRRMEKRLDGADHSNRSGVTIIDDIAHSPEKASSVLATLREIYHGKVIAIFEPNIGGRSHESAAKYDNAFKDADLVVIPRLSKLKTSSGEKSDKEDGKDIQNAPMEGAELATIMGRTHANVRHIESDEKLVGFLKSQTEKGDVIAFLGSHGFRGMIEEAISLHQRSPS